MVTKDFTSYHI